MEEEDVSIETVIGEHLISTIHGDTIFGKTQIFEGRCGSILVSQHGTKKLYQVFH
jgi:hypothetical protein